jgi:hypothetical protein
MPQIPPRAPVGDPFSGVLSYADARVVLSPLPLARAVAVAHGVVLRYGVRLLGKPNQSIVPGLIVLERGEMMTGDEAWAFLLKRSQLFPRTEVYGFRDDGTDDMLTLKWLDLALTPKVLAYADPAATVPLAEVAALIGPRDAFPARAAEYLPVYETLDELPA